MASTPESKLRDCITKYLKALKVEGHPVEWRKVLGSTASNGEPDWDIVYAGKSVKLEAKSQTGRVTPLQEYRMKQWTAAGAITGVVRSVDDVDNYLTQAGKNDRRRSGSIETGKRRVKASSPPSSKGDGRGLESSHKAPADRVQTRKETLIMDDALDTCNVSTVFVPCQKCALLRQELAGLGELELDDFHLRRGHTLVIGATSLQFIRYEAGAAVLRIVTKGKE